MNLEVAKVKKQSSPFAALVAIKDKVRREQEEYKQRDAMRCSKKR